MKSQVLKAVAVLMMMGAATGCVGVPVEEKWQEVPQYVPVKPCIEQCITGWPHPV